MIDALLWVGGVAVGLTFGFGVGRRRLEVDDQRVAETIAHLRQQVQDRDLQLNAGGIAYRMTERECDELKHELAMAHQRAEHPDAGRTGRYTTAKGVQLRVQILAVATHNSNEYAIIVPSDLPGATPYMIRHDAVTVDAE